VFAHERVNVDYVERLLAGYVSRADDWRQYAKFDKFKYTRNLVDTGNGRFDLMLLCWPESIASTIHDHQDSHCFMKILQGELQEVQAEVLERGSLADCINASAAVMGRIRDARGRKDGSKNSIEASTNASSPMGPHAGHGLQALPVVPRMAPVTPQEVEQFIADNRLDDSAARALQSVPPDVQAFVMDRGSLAVTMNPSSAVMGRIRDAKLAAVGLSPAAIFPAGGFGAPIGFVGTPPGFGTGAPLSMSSLTPPGMVAAAATGAVISAGLPWSAHPTLAPPGVTASPGFFNYGAMGVCVSEPVRANPY